LLDRKNYSFLFTAFLAAPCNFTKKDDDGKEGRLAKLYVFHNLTFSPVFCLIFPLLARRLPQVDNGFVMMEELRTHR